MFAFLSLPFGDSCILPVCFGLPLKRPFSNTYFVCLSIKKKKEEEEAYANP